MFNIAVVDDMKSDRSLLIDYLTRFVGGSITRYNVTEFESGEALLENFNKSDYDIIFLDVYMSCLTGMETAQSIRTIDEDCLIIFSTTSERHGAQSYRVRAFDYLLKPYDYDQFAQVMQLCEKALAKRVHFIEVKEGRFEVKVPLCDIIFVDYSNHYIQIHTSNRIVRCYMRFKDFSELLLIYPQFICCYRNCVVNMLQVASIEDNDFHMFDGSLVPISRPLKNEIRQKFADFAFQQLNGSD